MKSFKQNLNITMPEKQGFMDITDDLQECVRRGNIHDGICMVNTMHTTASVFTSSGDEEELKKCMRFYDKLVTLGDDSVRPVLKHQIMGNGVVFAINGGELDLGLTQFVIYADFDGEREKQVIINIIGD